MEFDDFPETLGNVIIPTDKVIFFRGVSIHRASSEFRVHTLCLVSLRSLEILDKISTFFVRYLTWGECFKSWCDDVTIYIYVTLW